MEDNKTISVEEHQKEIEKIKEELVKEYDKKANDAAAAARIEAKKNYEKQLAQEKMTAEERLKAENQEVMKELENLRGERKVALRKDALIKAKLPVDIFINNKSLLEVDDSKVEEVVSSLSKSWDSTVKEIRKSGVGDTSTHGDGDKTNPDDVAVKSARSAMGLKN